MFYYFGRKGRLAPLYAAPVYPLVIEPFAGSMAYTFHYQPVHAIGVEIDPAVHAAWSSVCGLTPPQIRDYPEPAIGEMVTDRWAMLTAGSHGTARSPGHRWTERMARDLRKQKRLAERLHGYATSSIDYRLGDYRSLPDVEATWFIDPPYQKVRRGYERSGIDYAELAEWCRTRRGQVIVCEQLGADWLPFEPIVEIRGTNNKRSTEVAWYTHKPCLAAAS